ncbi:putative polysaccharide biosynthesis protein [Mesobacillus harenae]|uniref:putative polysaccharide biosynthesis protein n=1 Tax=Mesobacillus harenae TaxID=2213203 RepID=UPI00157FD265|nr:polysaccharide biosynthesis protein [Mesobacillus harenae]
MKPLTDNSSNFFKGALILTAAALVTKILSAIYRVPFQNIVGDVGFYIYQQVYPFYGMILVLSTYGFPVAVSKLYSERKNSGTHEEAVRVLAASFIFLSILGVILFSALYYGADWLAGKMGDPELALLLRVAAVPFLFIPFVSVLRGYFQGSGNMVPTAYSQVGEQFVRVVTILGLASLFIKEGYNLYYAGAGAAFGSVSGGLISIIILGLLFKRERRDNQSNVTVTQLLKGSSNIIKALFIHGLSLSISAMLLIFLQMADSLNLYSLLLSNGTMTEEAKAAKGIYDRGQPLIQLGTILSTSMALSLIPLIANARLKKQTSFVTEHISLALKINILFGTGAALGLLSIIEPVNEMLFEDRQGSQVLAVLCFVILGGSAVMTLTSILQGLGSILYPAAMVLIAFVLKLLLNLVFVPWLGTMGSAISSVLSCFLVLVLLGIKLRVKIKVSLLSPLYLVKVAGSALLMVSFLFIYQNYTEFFYSLLVNDRLASAFQSISAAIFGGFIYIFALLRTSALSKKELSMLPFGSRLAFLLPKKTGGNHL